MKVHPYRFLKYCTALLVLLLLVMNCEHEPAETSQEAYQEDRVKRISLSELQSRIGNSSDYSKLSALFDVNKTTPPPAGARNRRFNKVNLSRSK